jgi:hypothetical protein
MRSRVELKGAPWLFLVRVLSKSSCNRYQNISNGGTDDYDAVHRLGRLYGIDPSGTSYHAMRVSPVKIDYHSSAHLGRFPTPEHSNTRSTHVVLFPRITLHVRTSSDVSKGHGVAAYMKPKIAILHWFHIRKLSHRIWPCRYFLSRLVLSLYLILFVRMLFYFKRRCVTRLSTYCAWSAKFNEPKSASFR